MRAKWRNWSRGCVRTRAASTPAPYSTCPVVEPVIERIGARDYAQPRPPLIAIVRRRQDGSRCLKGPRSLPVAKELFMPPTLGNGKVCYLETPAIDVGRSAAFYQADVGGQSRGG